MRTLLAVALVLALAAPLGAETYSWVDDSGTYNFTEDFSKVPRKYRKKVRRSDDLSSPEAPPAAGETAAPGGAAPPVAAGAGSAKDGGGGAGQLQLFGGKSEQAWRSELNLQELELSRLEGILADQQKEAQAASGVTRERLAELIKEREQTRTEYKSKYKEYLELLESARKAGFVVEMKKPQQ